MIHTIIFFLSMAVAVVGVIVTLVQENRKEPEPKDEEPVPLPKHRTLAEWFASTDEHGNDKSPGK